MGQLGGRDDDRSQCADGGEEPVREKSVASVRFQHVSSVGEPLIADTGAVDIQRLTRYSLKHGSLRPDSDGEFVSFAAVLQEIERTAPEREAIEFLQSAAHPPSVRVRLVAWLKKRVRAERG